MSVLCCRIPAFALSLSTAQPDPDRPLALLGPDDTVCAATPAAGRRGVRLGHTPHQAQLRCPDLTFQPLDLERCEAEQAAFLDTLTAWDLPIEAQGWGLAYLDLHPLTQHRAGVQPLAADLGRRLRTRLGERLQPTLGWDSSKFTARAAAQTTAPGHMRLVAKQHEDRFLRPLPLTLLPLSAPALQQLHWLGIRALGQFADLPAAAVAQRFGPSGRMAQRWAQGHDDRPVRPTHTAPTPAVETPFDPPATQLDPVVAAVVTALEPHLARLAGQLAGCTRLRGTCAFLGGEARPPRPAHGLVCGPGGR